MASIHKSAPILFIHTHTPIFKMPSALELAHVSLLHAYSFICTMCSYQVSNTGIRPGGKKEKICLMKLLFLRLQHLSLYTHPRHQHHHRPVLTTFSLYSLHLVESAVVSPNLRANSSLGSLCDTLGDSMPRPKM